MQEQAASPEQGPGASWLCLGEQQSPWPLSLFSTGTWELTSGSNFCLPGLASGLESQASHLERGLAALPKDLVSLFCKESSCLQGSTSPSVGRSRPLVVR